MKNINSMSKDKFDKTWQDAFNGAELEPTAGLWPGIESVIANDEAARYRRGLAYYKWTAAAGVMLIAGLLGYMVFEYHGSTGNSTTTDASETSKVLVDSASKTPTEENPMIDKGLVAQTPDSSPGSDKVSESPNNRETNAEEIDRNVKETNVRTVKYSDRSQSVSPLQPDNYQSKTMNNAKVNLYSTLMVKPSKEPDTRKIVVLPLLPESVTGIPIYPEYKRGYSSSLWAGINMTPGYFNPNYQSQGIVQGLQSGDFSQGSAQPMEEHRTGFSMSIGFEMGMRIARKWQLSGGLQYLNNNVQSTTNTILNQRTPVFSSVAESLDLSESRGMVTFAQTELDNTFKFLSIPIQAGFTVLDSKLKLQVNAGIASDIFLKNRITAMDKSLDPVTIDPGSNAPYRTVYFNGLVGAQASYEFLPRYLVTLEPRYKLAISDFARPQVNYTSLPSSFGIGLGVKYVFK